MPADLREQAELYFRALASRHDAYAALSTRGHYQFVPNSSHFIQIDHPEVVLAAINGVLIGTALQPPINRPSIDETPTAKPC